MKTQILLSTAIVVAGLFAIQPANAAGLSLTSFSPKSVHMPAPKGKLIGSSAFDGKTTNVFRNRDGSHSVVTRDDKGLTKTANHAKPKPGSIQVDDGKGGWKPYTPPAKSDEIGSTTRDGETTKVRRNDDGSHTIITDDHKGGRREIRRTKFELGFIYVDDGNGGWMKYEPKPKNFPIVLSSTNFDGKTIVVTLNADGSHTVTTTDNETGESTSETHMPGR